MNRVYCPIVDNGLGMVMSDFMVSFVEAMQGRCYRLDKLGDSLASRAMNRASATFLETDCDEILIWDGDIKATHADVSLLFSHNYPIVAGFYPIKERGLKVCAVHDSGEFPVQEEPLIEMRRTGRGFMRIKREVFEAMKAENGGKAKRYTNHGRDEWDFWSPGVYQPPLAVAPDEYLCENWAFCEHARELGFPIMCDQRISLIHRGSVDYPIPGTYEVRKREPWEYIPGWFNYQELYKRLADSFTDGSRFCEVGVWLGKSLGAMASYCKGKDVTLYAVDTFKGTQTDGEDCVSMHAPVVAANGGSNRKAFEDNMRKCGVNGNLSILDYSSDYAATFVPREFLDAVFIDADHSRDAVTMDIQMWSPRVKPGGVIAGHDYERESVRSAVLSCFDEKDIEVVGNCWVYRKP